MRLLDHHIDRDDGICIKNSIHVKKYKYTGIQCSWSSRAPVGGSPHRNCTEWRYIKWSWLSQYILEIFRMCTAGLETRTKLMTDSTHSSILYKKYLLLFEETFTPCYYTNGQYYKRMQWSTCTNYWKCPWDNLTSEKLTGVHIECKYIYKYIIDEILLKLNNWNRTLL